MKKNRTYARLILALMLVLEIYRMAHPKDEEQSSPEKTE